MRKKWIFCLGAAETIRWCSSSSGTYSAEDLAKSCAKFVVSNIEKEILTLPPSLRPINGEAFFFTMKNKLASILPEHNAVPVEKFKFGVRYDD